MKLIAKAKPVKIRIRVGGMEHTTLESLKENFIWEEVEPLLDGRLSKWLDTIGKSEIKQKFIDFGGDPSLLITYNFLFSNQDEYLTFEDIISQYKPTSRITTDLLSYYLRGQTHLSKVEELLKKHPELLHHNIKLIIKEIIRILPLQRLESYDSETLQWICEVLTDSYKTYSYTKQTQSLYEILKHRKAAPKNMILFFERTSSPNSILPNINIPEIFNWKDTKKELARSWNTNTPIITLGQQYSALHNKFFQFSNECLALVRKIKTMDTVSVVNGNSIRYGSICDKIRYGSFRDKIDEFSLARKDCPFYNERMVVAAIITNDRSYLDKIPKYKGQFNSINWSSSPTYNVQYFMKHLPDFNRNE